MHITKTNNATKKFHLSDIFTKRLESSIIKVEPAPKVNKIVLKGRILQFPIFVISKQDSKLQTQTKNLDVIHKTALPFFEEMVHIPKKPKRIINTHNFVRDVYENNDIIPRLHKHRVALVLRGHIRSSFENNKLYMFVKSLCNMYDVDIYIHAWHIIQNSISYRRMKQINTSVTTGTILEYFQDIPIKRIIIENDLKIKLIGNISGNICNTNVPTIGWKNMWYGIHSAIEQVPNDVYSTVILTRFDYFNLVDVLHTSIPDSLQTVQNSLQSDKILFAIHSESVGVDNFYCGNILLMKQLIREFHTNLEEICLKYKDIRTQEKLVWYVYHDIIDKPYTPNMTELAGLRRIFGLFRR
jgi:hypothetical protein